MFDKSMTKSIRTEMLLGVTMYWPRPGVLQWLDVTIPSGFSDIKTVAIGFDHGIPFGVIQDMDQSSYEPLNASDVIDHNFTVVPMLQRVVDEYCCQNGYDTLEEAKWALQWIHDNIGETPKGFYSGC